MLCQYSYQHQYQCLLECCVIILGSIHSSTLRNDCSSFKGWTELAAVGALFDEKWCYQHVTMQAHAVLFGCIHTVCMHDKHSHHYPVPAQLWYSSGVWHKL